MNIFSAATVVAAMFTVSSSLMILWNMNVPRKRRFIFATMIHFNFVQLFVAICMIVLQIIARNPDSVTIWGIILCIGVYSSQKIYENRYVYQDYVETNNKLFVFKDKTDKLIADINRRKPWYERER